MSDETEGLVTISYRKDGKTYLLAMPSDHAEWAEEMLNLDLAEAELAEVIDKTLIRHGEMAGMSNQERWDARDDIARAVAEWLKEQGGESCGE